MRKESIVGMLLLLVCLMKSVEVLCVTNSNEQRYFLIVKSGRSGSTFFGKLLTNSPLVTRGPQLSAISLKEFYNQCQTLVCIASTDKLLGNSEKWKEYESVVRLYNVTTIVWLRANLLELAISRHFLSIIKEKCQAVHITVNVPVARNDCIRNVRF